MEVRFETAKEDENQRIDKYLAQKMPEVSRSYLQKLLKERLVFVDGCAAKASY
ncbi:MAG: S4 domain-containing protein, partial [Blautia sp.]